MKRQSERVYQLKIALKGVKPPVWRRVLVSATTELADLHTVIQVAMGWGDYHLHQFVVGQAMYGEPDPDFDDDSMQPEDGIRIGSLLKKEKAWLTYEYDFGDSWMHRVTLEKVLPKKEVETLPICVAGKRACPPEDVGGPYGYAEFLSACEDESHPEHNVYMEWAGENFDPVKFDLEKVNDLLAYTFGQRP